MDVAALLDHIAALPSAQDSESALAAVREQVAALAAADLGRVETALIAAFDAIYGDDDAARTPEQVSLLAAIGDVTTAVRERIAQCAAAADQASALRTAMHPAPAVDPDPAPDPDAAPSDTPATPGGESLSAPLPTRVPLAAIGGHRPASADPAARPADGPQPGRAHVGLYVSSTGSPSVAPGDAIGSLAGLAELIHGRLTRMGQRAFELQHVARWHTDSYPDERTLTGDLASNEAKILAVTSPSAIVASGGICNPVNVDYAVPTWGDDARPLQDALPSFNATRGGLRFVSPPKISDSVATTATSLWSHTTDATPSGATKPYGTIACATENEAYVDAIPTIIKVGNMMARFSPEQVEANTRVAMVYAARFAELNLLKQITAASTTVLTNKLLGVHRDLLASLDLAIAASRYRHRLPENQRWRLLIPDWATDMIRADLVREQAHDDSGTPVRAVPDAQIEAWFTARGVNVTWLADGEPVDSGAVWSSGPTPVAQSFGAQAVSYLNNWPAEIHWWLYPEGSFIRLDGGTINLGVVRDSILDGTNDYETFVEAFESVAFRGVEAFRMISTVLPTGGSSLPIATSAAPGTLTGAAGGAHGTGGSF
ncbi:major capsid protein [Frankia sp. Cj3]|uniref:major capsid protein n=1 Tax=Frankia sp. Cj3 TaxID=2880976 RepID=UPI001EF40C07|nr:major capsid protein [Frankia sp. Cj3]